MDKSEKFWKSLGNFVNVYTVLGIVFGLSGGSAVITYLRELPIWVPIIFGVLSVGVLVISLTSMIIKYKRWKYTLKERKKIIAEKRAEILSIPEVLLKISLYELEIVKKLIETRISIGLIKEIKDSLKMRLKLPSNMLPRTIAEDMETTFKIMDKMEIKKSKPKNIIHTGLIISWILDEHKIGIGVSTAPETNQLYIETKNNLEILITKVNSKDLKDAIITFRNILLSGDSIYVCEKYFIGTDTPKEFMGYDTNLPEFEHTRNDDVQEYLTNVRKLAEIECVNIL